MRALILHMMQNYKAWKTFLLAKAGQLRLQKDARRAEKQK